MVTTFYIHPITKGDGDWWRPLTSIPLEREMVTTFHIHPIRRGNGDDLFHPSHYKGRWWRPLTSIPLKGRWWRPLTSILLEREMVNVSLCLHQHSCSVWGLSEDLQACEPVLDRLLPTALSHRTPLQLTDGFHRLTHRALYHVTGWRGWKGCLSGNLFLVKLETTQSVAEVTTG